MRVIKRIVALTTLVVTALSGPSGRAHGKEPVTEPYAGTLVVDRIDAELARLHALPVLAEDLGQQQKRVDRQLEVLREVAADLEADRPIWALAQMERAYVYLETLSFSAARSEIGEGGLDALQQEVDAFSSRLSEGEIEFFEPGLDELPAAYRAVAESVLLRVRTTRDAALASGGLYYLGQAQGLLDFALFCRSLGTEPSGRVPQVPALTEAITALELEVLDLYSPASAADRPVYGPFVQLNVTIKKARELDAQGYRYGALYTYLDARLRLELYRDSSTAPDIETLRRQAADWRQRLHAEMRGATDPDGADHSLGRLFWEAATSGLAGEPTEDDRRRASAIFDHVLPEYFHHLEETST